MMRSKKNKSPQETYTYFSDHICFIPKEKLTYYQIKCGKFRKFLLDITAVHLTDIRALYLYKSFAELSAAKFNHFQQNPFSIHPYSIYRNFLEIFVILALHVCHFILAVHYVEDTAVTLDYYLPIIALVDIVYVLHIISNCLTGYVEGRTSRYVVLDIKRIMIKYSRSWLIPDLISTTGLLFFNKHSNIRVNTIFLCLKIIRIPTLYQYTKNILRVAKASVRITTTMLIATQVIVYLEWNMFLQFAVYYYYHKEAYMVNINHTVCSWVHVAHVGNVTALYRRIYAFDKAVGMLRQNVNLHMLETHDDCIEKFCVCAWTIAKALIIHCSMIYTIMEFGSESAQAKYFVMEKQVQTYVDQRKFPPRMKKKVLKFYALRYQSHFFVESRMQACLSGQLREDIIMHTGRELVKQVAFLKNLPRTLLLQIGYKLKIVIFLAGDIIFKIHNLGDCMYFIAKGTVAIYSESGKEVCHLEDEDFFGEIALVMQSNFRTASVVAVTNCELFRLHKDDFESHIASYPTVYEDIKKEAASRLDRTNVIDEHHKTERVMMMGDALRNYDM